MNITLILAITGVSLLLIGIISVILAFVFRTVVPTNMVHIVQSAKKTIPYGKGKESGNVYYDWPEFLPLIGITVTEFPESIFTLNLKDYDAYDCNRLPFLIDIASFFRVENAETVAQRVASFDELEEQLRSVLQGSIRTILAKTPLETIMEERSQFGDHFTNEIREQIQSWGVTPVKNVEFMDIRDTKDSKVIYNIMAKEQSRIEMESRVCIADNNREAENKEIAAQQEIDVRKAEAVQKVGVREEESKQQVAESAKVTAEKEMQVKQVNDVRQAEINKSVAEVKAAEGKAVALLNAAAEKESAILRAEGEKESEILKAEGIKAEGIARGEAERAILQAPVDTQISLAKEIGENEGYQHYLIAVRQLEAQETIGKASAQALEHSDLKVIANAGDSQGGINSLMDAVSPKGGLQISAMMDALGSTEAGKQLLDKITNLAKKEKD